MGFIAIAQKCWDETFSSALLFFFDLAKNIRLVFYLTKCVPTEISGFTFCGSAALNFAVKNLYFFSP